MAKELSQKIREARRKLGITQRELATRLGHGTTGAVTKIEQGITTNMSIQMIKRLADALEISVAELLKETDYEMCRPPQRPNFPGESAAVLAAGG